MEKLYRVNNKKKDWELTVAQIMNSLLPSSDLNLRKQGKPRGNTRPFRYDLNQVSYDYTVEVKNRFKGLELIDRVPDELQVEVHDIVQEEVINIIPKKKKCRKAKLLSEEALQRAVKKKRSKKQKRKVKIYPFEFRGQPFYLVYSFLHCAKALNSALSHLFMLLFPFPEDIYPKTYIIKTNVKEPYDLF